MQKRERKPRGYWTPDTVKQGILERKEKGLGLSVTVVAKEESSLHQMARVFYGGWDKALEESGLDSEGYRQQSKRYGTPESVCIAIQELVDAGGDLSATAVRNENPSLYNKASIYYGNWETVLTASGLVATDYIRQRSKGFWTPGQVCIEIQNLAASGADLSVTEIVKENSSLYTKAREVYGNWESALTASGLVAKDYTRQHSHGYWTEERVCNAIKERAESGRDLTATAVMNEHLSLYTGATTVYGGWAKGLEASGINPKEVYKNKLPVSWTKDTLIEEIQRREHEGLGLTTGVVQKEDGGLYSTARKHFGGWREAIQASGLNDDDYFKNRPHGYWTAETTKKALQERKDAGLSFSREDVVRDDSALALNVTKYLGGWSAELASIGLNASDYTKQRPQGYWTLDTVKKELQERKDAGLSLKLSDVRKDNGSLMVNVYKYIGGWKTALEMLK